MQTVKTDAVKTALDRRRDPVLVNVLDEQAFEHERIPGSINIPVGAPDFEERVDHLVGDKDRRVIVYCASQTCDASEKAAHKLDEAGYANVFDYEGGLAAWKDAGLPVTGND